MTLRIIVTGGRDFHDRARVNAALDLLHSRKKITTLVEGGARGADRLAREWAIRHYVEVLTFEADWEHHQGNAGRIRNAKMARAGANLVVAFPGGKGTRHMVSVATLNGIPVWKPFG